MAGISFDQRDGWIWFNGEIVPWKEAKVHVLTHGLHYGSSVFEGERARDVMGVAAWVRPVDGALLVAVSRSDRHAPKQGYLHHYRLVDDGAGRLAGALAGTGSLTKVGSGTLTLTAANTQSGGTSVVNGTLALDFTAAGAPAARPRACPSCGK